LSLPWTSKNEREGDRKIKITALKHAAVLSRTPVREGEESQAPMVLDAHAAEWL